VYRLYDGIVRDMVSLPGGPRVMIATGLHQDPYPTELYYYRLQDHAKFLMRMGISFQSVVPLMSRDFTINFASEAQARAAAATLAEVKAPDETSLFSIDNRGDSLFVALSYPREIAGGFVPTLHGRPLWDISADVAFVALKNGEHNGTGYFIDTGVKPAMVAPSFRLAELPERVFSALGVNSEAHLRTA
jgi:hypothetical protein